MILKDLKKEIPFKWRVQSFSKFKKKATCVAYVDSRDVQDLLDKVCSPECWKDEYREIKGLLFCGISIFYDNQWITKWDTGSESDIEKEKGSVSDSFKRAAVKWGVGRFLYRMKIKYVDSSEIKSSTNKPYVVDSKGKRVWDLTKHIISSKPYQQTKKDVQKVFPPVSVPVKKDEKYTNDTALVCKTCKKEISLKVYEYSVGVYGAPLCYDCQKNKKK